MVAWSAVRTDHRPPRVAAVGALLLVVVDTPPGVRPYVEVRPGTGGPAGPITNREGTTVDKGLVEQVVAAAASVVASGAISANGHGNVSLRVPGAEEMYFTAAPSLKGLGPDGIVRVGLDGTLLEGNLPPIQGAVVAMHTAMYLDRPDVGCVLHTHSPFATAFAVA